MRAVIQRVSRAAVCIGGTEKSAINRGFMVLLGIAAGDTKEDAEWLCSKIAALRVFSDADGLMNLDLAAVNGELLLISQFTLHAQYKKGNRPSFISAARPEVAIPLYDYCIAALAAKIGKPIATGTFGADMQVSLVNDGPVTIIMDTQNRE